MGAGHRRRGGAQGPEPDTEPLPRGSWKVLICCVILVVIGLVAGLPLMILGGMTSSGMGVAGMVFFVTGMVSMVFPCFYCCCCACVPCMKGQPNNNASVTNAPAVAGQTTNIAVTPGVPSGEEGVSPAGAPGNFIFTTQPCGGPTAPRHADMPPG